MSSKLSKKAAGWPNGSPDLDLYDTGINLDFDLEGIDITFDIEPLPDLLELEHIPGIDDFSLL